MNITKITYAVLTAAVLLTVVPSCHKDSNEVTPEENSFSNEGDNEEAISKAKIASKITPEEYVSMPQKFDEFTDKVDKFSNKIAAKIGFSQSGNSAVSPLSIFMAMSMAAESANGDTREEILNMLGLSYEELSNNIRYLCLSCNQILNFYNEDFKGEEKNMIKCANSIWLKDGVKVKENGIKSLTTKYFSDIFKMDFKNSNVNNTVKSYINNETNGFLSPDLDLTPQTQIMLLNVVYLKEIWNEFGDELSFTNEKYDFVNYDNSKTPIQLLRGFFYRGRAIKTEKYKKFRTLTNVGLSLTFFVPNEGYSLDDIYTAEILDDKTPYVYEDDENKYYTRCLFPEFSANYDNEIQNSIKELGVKKLFGECDFSNLAEDVYCNGIKHVTRLEVKSKGIEGAAVTAMMMEATSVGPEKEKNKVYENFIVDKNFVYVLKYNGVPLFTGVVEKVK